MVGVAGRAGLALVPPQPLGVVAVVGGGEGPGLLLIILRISQTSNSRLES